MTCQEIADVLIDYVSGELPVETRIVFESHLRVCTDCRNYLDSYCKTIDLAKASLRDAERATDAMPADLVKAIMQAHRARQLN